MNFVIFTFIFFFLLPIRLKLTIHISIFAFYTQFPFIQTSGVERMKYFLMSIHPNNMQSPPNLSSISFFPIVFSIETKRTRKGRVSEFKHLPAKFSNPSSPILHESRFKLSNFVNPA